MNEHLDKLFKDYTKNFRVVLDSVYFDDYENPSFCATALERARVFLESNCESVLARFPDIQYGPDGSVDLFWSNEKFILLLNIPPDRQRVDYYGDDRRKNSQNKIMGFINHSDKVDFLFDWMKSFDNVTA